MRDYATFLQQVLIPSTSFLSNQVKHDSERAQFFYAKADATEELQSKKKHYKKRKRTNKVTPTISKQSPEQGPAVSIKPSIDLPANSEAGFASQDDSRHKQRLGEYRQHLLKLKSAISR